ncbi:hypothetical protein M569_16721 [Genlisea aurea]|uniref:Uncharacterized protein n=1 Tax=Genlisea aurea TaxID=192259 RepID=S8BU16_9LAMI|nr:hypothetical protein M569_16721 [Genlisea aurea]
MDRRSVSVSVSVSVLVLLFILLSIPFIAKAVPSSRSLKRESDDEFFAEKKVTARMDLELTDYGTGANNRHDLRLLPPTPPPPEPSGP